MKRAHVASIVFGFAIAGWVGATSRVAIAEPAPTQATTERSTASPSSQNEKRVADPLEASGMVVGPERPSRLWVVPRVLLFVPRLAVIAVAAPVRGTLYVVERYQLTERTKNVLFNDARTFGAYPTLAVRSGFGLSLGARVVHRDLFGAKESMSVGATYLGQFDQAYTLKLGSGSRLSKRATVELEVGYERRPQERFFGIGNGDKRSASSVTGLIDPTVDDTAVSTRYRQSSLDIKVAAGLKLGAGFALRASSGLERREFGDPDSGSSDPGLADIYDPNAVSGYDQTLDSIYSELELRFDSRRPDSHYVSEAAPSKGWLLAGRAGFNIGLDDDRQSYSRLTLDLQRYFDLYEGTRVIGIRFLASQVIADLDEIPFIYLPELGGDTLLRGYEGSRFRDRGLLLTQLDYKWELAPRYLSAYVFTDVGRPQDSVFDPSLDELRVGFGIGLQFQTIDSFLARTHIASSSDGGVFFNFDFNPVIDARVRD